MLIIGVSVGIVTGGGGTLVLQQLKPSLSADDQKFYGFLVSGICFHGLALLFINFFLHQHAVRWGELLGVDDAGWVRAAGIGLVTGLVVVPAALGLNELCRRTVEMFDPDVGLQPSLQVLRVAYSVPRRVLFGASALIVAPVAEEILFRGIAYKTIRDWGFPRTALASTSLLFGIIHANLVTLFPLTAFALVLALLYERTGRLIAPIAAHAIFNTINFILFFHAPP